MTPRLMVLVVMLGLAVATILVSFLPHRQRGHLYRLVGVPALQPAFADMHFVLASLDCARSGIPATERCPEAGYSFIYPKTFYLLLPTGLSARHTLPAAVVVFVAFSMSMFAFLRSLTWKQCCYVSALLCAPPTTLAMERCNIELVVVSLLALAALSLEARRWTALALTAILVSGLMKIYPAAALMSAAGRVRRWYLLAGALACALGLGIQADHLRFINENVIRISSYSWGYSVAFLRLRQALESDGLAWLVPFGAEHVLQLAAPALGVFLAVRALRRGCGPVREMPNSPGMLAGASAYCLCWMLGPNFDYRYLVLLLTLPFLFRSAAEPLRVLTAVALYAIVPMFCLSFAGDSFLATLGQEALGIAVFVSLFAMLLVFVFQEIPQSGKISLNGILRSKCGGKA